MKSILIFLFLVLLFSVSKGDSTDSLKVFEVTAEAHGFMCPFLTPLYIDKIHRMGNCEVSKTKDLVIIVKCLESEDVEEKMLLDAAELTGYERKYITVKRIK